MARTGTPCFQLGNKMAQKTSKKDADEIAEKILKIANKKDTICIEDICIELDKTFTYIDSLKDRFPSVNEAYEKAQQIISKRWTAISLMQQGQVQVNNRFLGAYSEYVRTQDRKLSKQNLKDAADEKIRVSKALTEQIKETLSLSPAQALLMQELIDKEISSMSDASIIERRKRSNSKRS